MNDSYRGSAEIYQELEGNDVTIVKGRHYR